jgi:hypothetical protein
MDSRALLQCFCCLYIIWRGVEIQELFQTELFQKNENLRKKIVENTNTRQQEVSKSVGYLLTFNDDFAKTHQRQGESNELLETALEKVR